MLSNTSGQESIKRRRGRPPKNEKQTHGQYITLYIAYPTNERVERLRNIVKGWNLADNLRYKRLRALANTPSEIDVMLMAQGKEKAKIERRYRVWLRKKIRLEKEIEDKTFRKTVRILARAIKNGKPVQGN